MAEPPIASPGQFSTDPMSKNFRPSVEQLAARDAAAAEFDSYWEFSISDREYRRKPEFFAKRWWRLVLNQRQDLFGMYWFTKALFHGDRIGELVAHEFPISHDDMPIPGYPRKYTLNGYSVRQRDLKFLTGGPLYDRAQKKVIVVPFPLRAQIGRAIVAATPAIGLVGLLLTIAGLIVGLLAL